MQPPLIVDPLQGQTPSVSKLVKWGTPTLIPNTDEPSPTLKTLYVVSGINTAPLES